MEMAGQQIACPTCGQETILKADYQWEYKAKMQIPKPKDYISQEDRRLLKCRVCGKAVSPNADICPHCGEPSPSMVKHCPKCNSMKVTASNERILSYGKAAAATLLFGPIGLLAGLIPKNHTFFRCLECGHSF
jgi:RNA polymerase subunit RPABC4/transcription elongation factor Spt4